MKRMALKYGIILSAILSASCLWNTPAWSLDAEESRLSEQELYQKACDILDNYSGNVGYLYKAQQYCQKILEKNPKNALAYVGLARTEYKMGYINYDNYDEDSLKSAQFYLDRALQINPSQFEAYIAKSHVFLFQKDVPNAIQTVAKAQALKPGDPDVLLLEAQIALKQKNWDEAKEKATKILDETKENRLKLAAWGIVRSVCLKQKDYAQAEKTYKEELALDPRDPWVQINYASFLTDRGEFDKAIELGESSLKEMDFGMGHHVLSRAYYKKGYDLCWKKKDYENARTCLEAVVKHDPQNVDAYYGLGVCYRFISYKLKDRDLLNQSEQAFKKALEINPDYEPAKKELEKHAQWVGGKNK